MKTWTIAVVAICLPILGVAGWYFWPEVQVVTLELPAYVPEVTSAFGRPWEAPPLSPESRSPGYHAGSSRLGFGRELLLSYDPALARFDAESNVVCYVVKAEIRYFSEIKHKYLQQDN